MRRSSPCKSQERFPEVRFLSIIILASRTAESRLSPSIHDRCIIVIGGGRRFLRTAPVLTPRSGRARTNPANYAYRASSRSCRGAAPSHEETLLALPRLLSISIRDREAAF